MKRQCVCRPYDRPVLLPPHPGTVGRDGQVLDSDPRELEYSYHQRWALSCATLVLSVFALALAQRMVTAWAASLGALGSVLIYYVLLWTGRAGVLQRNLPAFAGAWLPNALFALVCVAVIAATLSASISSGRDASAR
jgi:lipopolysaccharide export LptBFGC system permease protein LptF